MQRVLSGQLRLLPDTAVLSTFHEECRRVVDAGMFTGTPPSFDRIAASLSGDPLPAAA